MDVRLDGGSHGKVSLAPRTVTSFECSIPPTCLADGVLDIDIANLAGEFASVSELYLWQGAEPSSDAAEVRSLGGQTTGGLQFTGLCPNPSSGKVMITYMIRHRCDIQVQVFDLAGRVVRTMSQEEHESGPGVVVWDGRTNTGSPTSAGIYFVRLTASGRLSGAEEPTSTRKLVMIR
jgi:hypothetical protein